MTAKIICNDCWHFTNKLCWKRGKKTRFTKCKYFLDDTEARRKSDEMFKRVVGRAKTILNETLKES